jgi:hypothetical protein
MRKKTLVSLICFGLSAHAAFGQMRVEPVYSIWDVNLGQHVSHLPDTEVSEIACGTAGGPPARPLVSFKDFMLCAPEQSGLREVAFIYDDEQDYIAKALELEYKSLQGGTSVFAHPVTVSLLVDPAGVVKGRRIFTDNRIRDYERRTAFTLIRNFRARYGEWSLNCADIAMKEGEQPVGSQFVHERCMGQSPDGGTLIVIEASYLRKKGQRGVNTETQQVNTGYFESQTRYEEVLVPYTPVIEP